MIILSEDVGGNLPNGADAKSYANAVKVDTIPVTVDPAGSVVKVTTPWTGVYRPGKCALSPEMEILKCYTGSDDAEGFAAIKAHAGL